MRAFEKDLEKIYSELERRNEELNGYYTLLDDEHPEASMVVDNFLEELALFKNKESIMATLTRIVSLKEDSIHQILKNLIRGWSDLIRFFPVLNVEQYNVAPTL